jgi:hypothetical protein
LKEETQQQQQQQQQQQELHNNQKLSWSILALANRIQNENDGAKDFEEQIMKAQLKSNQVGKREKLSVTFQSSVHFPSFFSLFCSLRAGLSTQRLFEVDSEI